MKKGKIKVSAARIVVRDPLERTQICPPIIVSGDFESGSELRDSTDSSCQLVLCHSEDCWALPECWSESVRWRLLDGNDLWRRNFDF